jgi:hypothetical protein
VEAPKQSEEIVKLWAENARLRHEQTQQNLQLTAVLAAFSELCGVSHNLGLSRQLLFMNELLAAVNKESALYRKHLHALYILMRKDYDGQPKQDVPRPDSQPSPE